MHNNKVDLKVSLGIMEHNRRQDSQISGMEMEQRGENKPQGLSRS
jgi:hypothetical protein